MALLICDFRFPISDFRPRTATFRSLHRSDDVSVLNIPCVGVDQRVVVQHAERFAHLSRSDTEAT